MHNTQHTLPDITAQPNAQDAHPLDWVGMEKIGLPILLPLADGSEIATSAHVDIFVSLDTAAKGIHMSRLYLKLNEELANQLVTRDKLNTLLDSVLQSHQGLSNSAKVRLTFDLPLSKKALLSDNFGYQVYSVTLDHELREGQSATSLSLTVPYSSTCPCSSSLANQLNSEALSERFPDETLIKSELIEWLTSRSTALATPHNQRSYAYLKLDLSSSQWPSLDAFIFEVEAAIGTPVQTAVKREDEQEFARLNGSNLLFCEDAARRIKGYLETLDFVLDYWFKVEHQESLHAHNAVVIDKKR